MYDVNTCRFFPSGIVVLSGGMDAQLKIWSVEDGNCSVTLNGHKGGKQLILWILCTNKMYANH